MSYVNVNLWLFEPSGDACDACEETRGLYSYQVDPPHPNCQCNISSGDVKAELIATREELVDQYEMVTEIQWVPSGGQASVQKTWSTGTEVNVSGNVSVEGAGVGASLGGGRTDSVGVSVAESVTFNYDQAVGGSSQMVVAIYQVKVFQIVETYQAHWSEGMGVDYQFDVIAQTREERTFAGYRAEAF